MVRFVAPQAFGIGIRVTRPSREHQFHANVEMLEGIDQEMAVFSRRKPTQEKDIVIGEEIPLDQLPREAPWRQRRSIGDVDGIALVPLAVMPLQGA